MVKEFKLSSVDVNFSKEMESLITEDTGKRSRRIDETVQEKGESAQRFRGGAPARSADAFQAEDVGPDASVDMHEVLARQMNLEYVELNDYPEPNFKLLSMIPANLAKQYRAFPLQHDPEEGRLVVAICDPSDVTTADDLSLALGVDVHTVVAKESEVMDRINRHYGLGEETISSLLKEFESEGDQDVLVSTAGRAIDLSDMATVINAPPVVRLADLVLMKAIQDRASDIHIEPFENLLRIRYRVDGVLREMESPPKHMQLGLISRLKVSANLDIAETRRPQDGRINLHLPHNREVELRVTTSPTVHGECIVMRVLDKSMMQIGIHQIGMAQDVLEGFLYEIRKPNGIVLVTGPTGCGKTTTLYAALNEVKSPEDKIITTEDPVEYQVDGIVQININDNVGLTYGRCLRSILRQDPDKILVGEIRDLETAQISIQAALTGHLVFSTLHTNSAAGTITRLIDMGVEPFLITSTLQGVIGQRLVRTICPNCRRPHTPTAEELLEFGVSAEDVADIPFFEGAGCDECSFTGYKGRMGIFELLKVTEQISELILERATTDEIQALAQKQGMATLRQDGWIKVCTGLTTFHEVASHTPSDILPGEVLAAKGSGQDTEGSGSSALPGLG
jgi:type II secretory ATPase GspE/PulE/Tfp pilus assembly ATPase PilB-like protein